VSRVVGGGRRNFALDREEGTSRQGQVASRAANPWGRRDGLPLESGGGVARIDGGVGVSGTCGG
jgi:hypothetical protein